MTNDGLLFDAAEEATKKFVNVRILRKIEDLKSALNAINAQLSKEQIEDILARATAMFFRANDATTLFFVEGIEGKIGAQYSKLLSSPPATMEGTKVQKRTIDIKPTVFTRRQGDVFEFSTGVLYGIERLNEYYFVHQPFAALQ